MHEHVAGVCHAGWIDCGVSFVNVANDSIFIDHESRAISKALFFVKDAIVLDHSAFEIAEDGKRDPKLFCKFAVGGNTVNAHAENLSVG